MSVKQQKFQNDQSVSDWTKDKTYSTLIIKSCNLNHGSFHLIQSPPPCWASSWPHIFLSSFSPSITDSWAVSFDESCAFSFLSKSSCRLRRWSCCTSASSERRRLCQVKKQHRAKMTSSWVVNERHLNPFTLPQRCLGNAFEKMWSLFWGIYLANDFPPSSFTCAVPSELSRLLFCF